MKINLELLKKLRKGNTAIVYDDSNVLTSNIEYYGGEVFCETISEENIQLVLFLRDFFLEHKALLDFVLSTRKCRHEHHSCASCTNCDRDKIVEQIKRKFNV